MRSMKVEMETFARMRCIYSLITRNQISSKKLPSSSYRICPRFSSTHSEVKIERIFSGIQPTGSLHLGNYFGAIQRWVSLQNQGKDCIYCIVDLHSITLPQEPQILRNNIYTMIACLLACGLKPEKCTLFLQSQIPFHTELAWILGCLTTMPRLSHLPQYKEKSAQVKEIPLGLFVYPVLQSADILLYKASSVPVGEDQVQHIQLAQHLAKLFNNKFKHVFPHPKSLLETSSASRLKSLRNPSKKMSKSDPDPRSFVSLMDDSKTVCEKFKKAITDFTSEVTYDPDKRPGVSNLIMIHSLFTGLTPEEICEQSKGLETAQYKLVLADVTNEHLTPIREEVNRLLQDKPYLSSVLKIGAEKASAIAEKTMKEVKNAIGVYL